MVLLYDLTPTIHKVDYSLHISSKADFKGLYKILVPILGKYKVKGDINNKQDGKGFIEYYETNSSLSLPNEHNFYWSRLSFFPEEIDIYDLIVALKTFHT